MLRSEIGYLFLDRTRIRPAGFRIGEHVFALGLAPGEEVTLEQRTFAKRQVTFEEQNEEEQQFDLELASTLATELQEGFELQKSRSDASGLSLSHTGSYTTPDFFWGKINASHTIGYTRNIAEASQETSRRSAKDSQTASSKVAAKYRTLHKTTFKVAEERGFETSSKRTIRNPNRYTPITLHYFKVLQHLQLTQERYGCRVCWTPAVKDPAASYFAALAEGKQTIIDRAKEAIPPEPTAPVRQAPPQNTTEPPPPEVHVFWSDLIDANKWGLSGDQSADYTVDVSHAADFRWDGDKGAIQILVETQRQNPTVEVKGMPIETSSEGTSVLRCVVHVGTGSWIGGPGIKFQIGPRFVKPPAITVNDAAAEDAKYNAVVAAYAVAHKEWSDKRDRITAEAIVAADAWEVDALARLDPIVEMIGQVIRHVFPSPVTDECWEIDLWQKLFDWEQATYTVYPAWWVQGPLRDPAKDPSDFVNASWARLYLPVRVGAERLALRWVFGKQVEQPLDQRTEAAFDTLIEDLAQYRRDHFGSEIELPLGEGECPEYHDAKMCVARWHEEMPTDGTHVEVIQGCTSAADATTQSQAEADSEMREAVVKRELADAALRDRLASLQGDPGTLVVHVDGGSDQP